MGKLVRDKIPDIIKMKGETPDIKTLNTIEFFAALKEKLAEETEEVCTTMDNGTSTEVIDELADVTEVIMAIAKLYDFPFEAVLAAAEVKRDIRGGFNEQIYLIT